MKYQSLVNIQRQNACMRWQSLIVDKYANLRYGIRNSHMQRATPKSYLVSRKPRGPKRREMDGGPGSDRRESSRQDRDAIDQG